MHKVSLWKCGMKTTIGRFSWWIIKDIMGNYFICSQIPKLLLSLHTGKLHIPKAETCWPTATSTGYQPGGCESSCGGFLQAAQCWPGLCYMPHTYLFSTGHRYSGKRAGLRSLTTICTFYYSCYVGIVERCAINVWCYVRVSVSDSYSRLPALKMYYYLKCSEIFLSIWTLAFKLLLFHI